MRTATSIVVGALVAMPAHANRSRVSLEASFTLGATQPFGIGASLDIVGPLAPEAGIVAGGGVRIDGFPGSGIQVVFEPIVGAAPGIGTCEFNPSWVLDVRPGFALRTRGGPALSLATSGEYGEFVAGRLRLGGLVPLSSSPKREARSAGGLEDFTFSAGVGLVGQGPSCVVGRPLREDGEMVLAAAEGADHALAARWLEQAREEHAAVAAFRRLAAELETLDAPVGLVAACERAAVEEAEHARLCLQRAANHSRRPAALERLVTRPRSFATREEALRTLALESWEDGFLNEGRAAADAWQQALTDGDPQDRRVHLKIAHEEAEHAQLGARVAAWCSARAASRSGSVAPS